MGASSNYSFISSISNFQYLLSLEKRDYWYCSVCNGDFNYSKGRQLGEPPMSPNLLESEDIEEQRMIELLLGMGTSTEVRTRTR